jgi:cytidine deaminase
VRPKRISNDDRFLITKAFELARKRKSRITRVASVLRTVNGRIFQGVNIEAEGSAPCSMCAEYAAIGTMVSEGERRIDTIVAVNGHKHAILPPCGKCRQMISEFGDPYVIFNLRGRLIKAKLSQLYPIQVK